MLSFAILDRRRKVATPKSFNKFGVNNRLDLALFDAEHQLKTNHGTRPVCDGELFPDSCNVDKRPPLNITRFAIKGPYANDFGQTNNCGNSVATGANFSMAVLFTPSTTGARMATLSITDTASGSQTVSLSGTGTVPAAGLSRTNLSFASQSVGTTSTAQTTTLGNSGNATSTIRKFSVPADVVQWA